MQKSKELDFQKAFATDSGKMVLKHLSLTCHENEPTYVEGNTHGTAYKEGQRSIILHIRAMLGKENG